MDSSIQDINTLLAKINELGGNRLINKFKRKK